MSQFKSYIRKVADGYYLSFLDTTKNNAVGRPLEIGHLHVLFEDITDKGWRIGDIYVNISYRRKGVATAMVQKMSQKLGSKPKGASSVFSTEGHKFFDSIKEENGMNNKDEASSKASKLLSSLPR